MSTTHAIITLVELAVSCLLVYGFMHEDKVIEFEQVIKRIIVGNVRRVIRLAKHKMRRVRIYKQKVCSSIYNTITKREAKRSENQVGCEMLTPTI